MIRILVFLPLAACSFGIGSSFVGQWSPKQQVEFEACLVEETPPNPAGTPTCKDTKQVVREVPGRKFWGVIVPFPAIGASRVSYQDKTTTEFRAEPSFEILKGSGRWAYGVRSSVMIDSRKQADGMGGSAAGFAMTALGHVSVMDELGLYGGVGYLPYSGLLGERTFVGGRGLVGLQLALNKTHSETFIVLSFEVDRMYLQLDDAYQSTGFTGHFGIFF